LRVLPDPRIPFDGATARRVVVLQDRLLAAQREANQVADRIREAQEAVERVREVLDAEEGDAAESLSGRSREIDAALDTLWWAMVGETTQGRPDRPELVNSRLGDASGPLNSGRWAEPTQAALRALERAEASVAEFVTRVDAFFDGPWAEYRRDVEAAGIGLFGSGG